jgi:hypothetical protein
MHKRTLTFILFPKPFPDTSHKNTRFVLQHHHSESPTRAPPLLLTSSLHQLRIPRSPVISSRLLHTSFDPRYSPHPSPCTHGKVKCLCLPIPGPNVKNPNNIRLARQQRKRKRKRKRGVWRRPPQKIPPCSSLGYVIQYPVDWLDYDLFRKD